MSKKIFLVLVFLLFFFSNAFAHVCSDVLPGGSQAGYGCLDPVVITITDGPNYNGNQISFTINVENRQTFQNASGKCNPWSSNFSNVVVSVYSCTTCTYTGCPNCDFEININPSSQGIPIHQSRDFDVTITIKNAAPGTYSMRFKVKPDSYSSRYVDATNIQVTSGSCTPDGCNGNCPAYCEEGEDPDCGLSGCCGDSTCNPGETCSSCAQDCGCNGGDICCSGSCIAPTCISNPDCSDGDSCTTDTCNNPGTCSSSCSNPPITSCINSDGCCPGGCTILNDNDCEAVCGDGSCNGTENCSTCAQDCSCIGDDICCSGSCVEADCSQNSECDDSDACTTNTCSNAGTCSAECTFPEITFCVNSDGCCPSGCTTGNDNDCSAECGDGTCNGAENCESCSADCSCTTGICCSGSCEEPTCSNNSGCDDSDSCTNDSCNNAGTCSSSCSNPAITSCVNSDSCCPSGCTTANDNDCGLICGNEVCETGECSSGCSDCEVSDCCGNSQCNSGVGENCSSCSEDCSCGTGLCCDGSCITPACADNSACNDSDACTTDSCNNPNSCSASCSYAPKECADNDGCCPAGCTNENDNDCSLTCGDGQCTGTENCSTCQKDCGCVGEKICCNGSCAETACKNDAECNDNDSLTEDVCENPGKCNSECKHNTAPDLKEMSVILPQTIVDKQSFTAKVVDKDSKPVSGVKIAYLNQTATTNSNGEAVLTARKGTLKLTAEKIGFKTSSIDVFAKEGVEIKILDPDSIPFAVSIGDRDKIEMRPGETIEVRIFVRNGHTEGLHNLKVNADNTEIVKKIEPEIIDELKPNEIKSFVATLTTAEDAELGSTELSFEVEAREFTRSRIVTTTLVVSEPSDLMIFVYAVIVIAIIGSIAFKIFGGA